MTKYTFWPNSLPGLDKELSLQAATYEQAKKRALKMMFQHRQTAKYTIIEHWESIDTVFLGEIK